MPYPPIKGGVIDVFYKIKALSEHNVDVILHCFVYDNSLPAKVLETYCKQIYYYKRAPFTNFLFDKLPFIVASRQPKELLENLLLDKHPIIFDGIHTCGFLNHRSLSPRNKIVRPQNIESEYYSQLAANTNNNLVKKKYYEAEAKRLNVFEDSLHAADVFICVASQDYEHFKMEYGNAIHKLIPSFHGYASYAPNYDKYYFCLYQGNLAVAENEVSALYLIENVFSKLTTPFVIAGANPSDNLKAKCKRYEHVRLIANPNAKQMQELMASAQINVLPSMQNTGLKLKLLHALHAGKHCLVNTEMVHGTMLQDACAIANTPEEFIAQIQQLISTPFTENTYNYRLEILNKHYNVDNNVQELIKLL